jgi:hypothetical protein
VFDRRIIDIVFSFVFQMVVICFEVALDFLFYYCILESNPRDARLDIRDAKKSTPRALLNTVGSDKDKLVACTNIQSFG